MAEVGIIGRIFVLCRKWDGCYYQPHGIVGIAFCVLQFQYIVIVCYAVAVAGHLDPLDPLDPELAGEVRRHFLMRESVFLYDFCHVVNEFVMVLPFGFKSLSDPTLCLGVDEVHPYDFRLKESLQSVNGLYEVIELISYAEIDGP